MEAKRIFKAFNEVYTDHILNHIRFVSSAKISKLYRGLCEPNWELRALPSDS